jgi:hypothetical protein
MPKQTHVHTIHLTDAEQAIVNERAGKYPSLNAYFVHCIVVEKANAFSCERCEDRALAESVRSVFAKVERPQRE